ncbi:MAG: hypothetical protein U5L96_05950 [Owenweeksia sp.]|nr:hypothetical protein [Owenweeksia sp.]
MLRVSYGDSGSYRLSVSAPGSNCATVSDSVRVSAFPKPAKPVISFLSSGQLSSSQASSYQWLKNGDSIAGANQQNYNPTSSGFYQVLITNQHGCTSISDSVQPPIGLQDFKAPLDISLYPNPARQWTILEFGKQVHAASLRMSRFIW